MSYQVTDTSARIRFAVASQNMKKTADARLLFVIDRSGSMSGSPLKQVHQAVEYIMNNCGSTPADFILYDDKAVRVDYNAAKSCAAGGMTSFVAALKAVRQFVTTESKSSSGSNLSVVFMTDGCDTIAKGNELENECNEFKFFAKSHCQLANKSASASGFTAITVHTLGFGTSHDAKRLEKLREIGTVTGLYRYAEGASLNEKFADMFDFMVTTGNIKISFDGNKFIDVEYEKDDDGFKIDAFYSIHEIGDEVHDQMVCGEPFLLHVKTTKDSVVMVTLAPEKVDNFFHLRELESIVITSKDELDGIQRELSAINPMSFPKEVRKDALELRCAVQCKLDEYHALYAEVARGTIADGTVAAKLQSLKFEAKFAKARRKRAMDRRVAGNAGRMMEIDDKLSVLEIDIDAIAADSEIASLICPLSGLNAIEILKTNNTDVIVFPLRISRAEFTVEAPSEVQIMDVLNGTYSFDAVNGALAHSLRMNRAESVHGGFNTLAPDAGLFRGMDGKYMNAVLPMYLHKEHWRRVSEEIEPVLGYFFTLDPLGFKGDQYLAMFSILGQMLTMKAKGVLNSDYHAWLIQDFTRVCSNLKQRVLRYLKAGLYASGKLTGDPLDAFISTPAARTKEVIPNLMTILGWYHVRNIEGSVSDDARRRFIFAYYEEAMRRSYSKVFNTQPFAAEEWVARLLYGSAAGVALGGGDAEAPLSTDAVLTAKPKISDKLEKQFAAFCKYKLNLLSNKHREECEKHFRDGPPKFEVDTAGDIEVLKTLSIASDEAVADVVDGAVELVKNELKMYMMLFDPVQALAGHPHYDSARYVDSATLRYMCIQAILYCRNSDINAAVERGDYVNLYDAQADGKLMDVVCKTHQDYQRRLSEKTDAIKKQRADMFCAKCITLARTLEAFCGRLMATCPTRGGVVFLNVVQLLCQSSVDGTPIPFLAEKIRVIMTGKTNFGDGSDIYNIISNGQSWIQCDPGTADRVRDAVGEDVFVQIECSMYGRSGWVYRLSDIPNRHGHCNSHPNPGLVWEFKGFRLPNRK